MEIYHNPRCRKSRETLALMHEKGVEPEIIEYLKTPPTRAELEGILQKLDMRPHDLIRKKEAIYKENYKGKELSDEEWVVAMVANPKLIERPIGIEGEKAIIGRPPEKVLELI